GCARPTPGQVDYDDVRGGRREMDAHTSKRRQTVREASRESLHVGEVREVVEGGERRRGRRCVGANAAAEALSQDKGARDVFARPCKDGGKRRAETLVEAQRH